MAEVYGVTGRICFQDRERIMSRVFKAHKRMERLMSRPLYDKAWMGLPQGSFEWGRSRKGSLVKIPERMVRGITPVNGYREVTMTRRVDRGGELTPESDGKPIPRDTRRDRYEIFGAVRSRMHEIEGHAREFEALLGFVELLIELHYETGRYRSKMTDKNVGDMADALQALAGRGMEWKNAYKILARFKLEMAVPWQEAGVENRSAISIALTKLASAEWRLTEWRPRQMRQDDVRAYCRECVLRLRRDDLIVQDLEKHLKALSGNDADKNFLQLRDELVAWQSLGRALDAMRGRGAHDWNEVRAGITAAGGLMPEGPRKQWLRSAWSRTQDRSKGRAGEVREALQDTMWGIGYDKPWHFAGQLAETGEWYMKRAVKLLNSATGWVERICLEPAVSALAAAHEALVPKKKNG